MRPTLPQLSAAFTTLGYRWHPAFNLVGVRATENLSDVFNDVLVACWMQPSIPAFTSVIAQQIWLNDWFILGADGRPLVEDGKAGPNFRAAVATATALAGQWRSRSWTITTDPGAKYLLNPTTSKGCAVLVPGQHRNVWILGLHQGKKDHPALVQHGGPICVYRDNDRDALAEASKDIVCGYYGINCHHASVHQVLNRVGGWSAGCQVFPNHLHHAELLQLCRAFDGAVGKHFTYTLLTESQLS